MDVHLFLYDNFADFEITQLLLIFKKHNIITVGFEKGLVQSYGQLKVFAEYTLQDINPSEVELFIIPGGEPKLFIRNPDHNANVNLMNKTLEELKDNGALIAAICGGPVFLANSGILNGLKCTATIEDDEKEYFTNTIFTGSDIEVDGGVVTAKGQAFTEFAVEVAKLMKVIISNEEAEGTINWFRNKKD
ncbi:MAG: DJ-1/PfpI family protein [Candidatus Heimdallarchaeota archaeon]|nr:DJ-1/PfpI family protein [Candidatus Heimdallarchaeota archaeon]